MRRVLYIIFAWPFITIGTIASWIVWVLFHPASKPHYASSQAPFYQDLVDYNQQLLKEISDQKRENEEIHDYYKRKERNLINSYDREAMRLEQLRHRNEHSQWN